MRIRTIKPEFWANEKLCGLAEISHMTAAALLNYSDDDGYFNANPALIKAALFPLREPSRTIPVILRDLCGIEYMRVGVGGDGRNYGHIVSFHEHQSISKKTPSKIKVLDIVWEDSGSTPLPESEDSTREGKGREGKTPRSEFSLPDWIPEDVWTAFAKMRTKIRAPLTDDAKTLTVRELAKLRDQGHDPRAVLEQSISRSWRGLFPPKTPPDVGRRLAV